MFFQLPCCPGAGSFVTARAISHNRPIPRQALKPVSQFLQRKINCSRYFQRIPRESRGAAGIDESNFIHMLSRILKAHPVDFLFAPSCHIHFLILHSYSARHSPGTTMSRLCSYTQRRLPVHVFACLRSKCQEIQVSIPEECLKEMSQGRKRLSCSALGPC